MLNATLSLLVLFLSIFIIWDALRKRNTRLPPGPPGLPLLGNILQHPAQFLYRKLHAWSHEYGPIYTIWMGIQPFVILGSAAVSEDVLEPMSAVTSDRPVMIKARKFFFRDMNLVWQDHTLTVESSAPVDSCQSQHLCCQRSPPNASAGSHLSDS
ncbi:hypothetical protein CALCODRAFT_240900 [Calocera cornea HHB12733]|uniref:Cytochrome P450 n=1 Tax=Calocera cornea HHB12733 TaxID=1353952 RepID=A0A165GTU6_9BASI|nr:hypothetical protein CALCODRAFT_240900 [Calocera cornea HHB12733]